MVKPSLAFVSIKLRGVHNQGGFVVPPLEGLWWADGMKGFVLDNKDDSRGNMILMMSDFVNQVDIEDAQVLETGAMAGFLLES